MNITQPVTMGPKVGPGTAGSDSLPAFVQYLPLRIDRGY